MPVVVARQAGQSHFEDALVVVFQGFVDSELHVVALVEDDNVMPSAQFGHSLYFGMLDTVYLLFVPHAETLLL